jgi:hypothetical protein
VLLEELTADPGVRLDRRIGVQEVWFKGAAKYLAATESN